MDIIIYDPASTPVANRVTNYKRSVDSNLWLNTPNVLFDVLPTVPQGQTLTDFLGKCIVDNGAVREMTQAEKDSIAAAVAAANAAAEEAALTERNALLQAFDNSADMYFRLSKALALVTMDEINILRGQHSLAARTSTQLLNAVKAKL